MFFSSPEGIEKVEIVQMENALVAAPRIASNVLDVTVTCEGRWVLWWQQISQSRLSLIEASSS